MQAQFVIPMALSLGFGIVFATTMTLILVPCCYRIVYDFKDYLQKMRSTLKSRIEQLRSKPALETKKGR